MTIDLRGAWGEKAPINKNINAETHAKKPVNTNKKTKINQSEKRNEYNFYIKKTLLGYCNFWAELIAHTFTIILIVLCSTLSEIALHHLLGSDFDNRLLYNKLPMQWIFDTIELSPLVCFMFFGIFNMLKSLRYTERDQK